MWATDGSIISCISLDILHLYLWKPCRHVVDVDSLSLWNCYCLRQDPREFSDDISEDSGFEESVGATDDRKREQRLENDKYDMALEVRLPIPDMYRVAQGRE